MRKSVRPVSVFGVIAIIPLTRGKQAIIDTADLHIAAGRNWHAVRKNNVWYARTSLPRNGGKKRFTLLHREIMGLGQSGPDVDHRDGDGLNCRRSNMREATKSQNACNSPAVGSSGLRGVSLHRASGRWRARICRAGREKHIGLFETKEAASAAYMAEAVKSYGEFARRA